MNFFQGCEHAAAAREFLSVDGGAFMIEVKHGMPHSRMGIQKCSSPAHASFRRVQELNKKLAALINPDSLADACTIHFPRIPDDWDWAKAKHIFLQGAVQSRVGLRFRLSFMLGQKAWNYWYTALPKSIMQSQVLIIQTTLWSRD